MPIDPVHPDTWINKITLNQPPFIQSLCKSLYCEPWLVRAPARPKLCRWGMTSQGRIGPLIDEDDADYAALVRQEDPEANSPWAFAVAAFKYAGGNVPQPTPGADKWEVVPLYEALTRYMAGNQEEAHRAAKHYTQSVNLVAVHPVVYHLMSEYPCIVSTLQARAFTAFLYDPAEQFAPGAAHDNCGFV